MLPSIFYHNDVELTNPTEIANALHFANIGKNLAAEIERNINDDGDFTQYLTAPILTKCKFRCVTQAEIVQAIDKLENNISFGHDGISNKLLKLIKDDIISSLTLIVNKMITTGIFPDLFKKKFERIFHNQMYDHFNDKNLLAEQQYGFRKLHCTEFAAVKLADYIRKQMESGNIPCNLYIDLSKAFDTLSYDILLHKLRYYGFSGT